MNAPSPSRLASLEEQKIYQTLQTSMPEQGLFDQKTWRQSPAPFLISKELQKKLEKLGDRLHAFNKACDLLYRQSVEGKQPSWIASLLDRGKPPELIELARSKIFRGVTASVIRPDLLLTKDGFVICELDQIPGGIGLTSWLQKIYTGLGYSILGGPQGMLHGFQSIFKGNQEGDILVSEESATYRPEMLYLIEELQQYFPEIRWRLLSTNYQKKWASRVYRFFELFDIANVECAADLFVRICSGEISMTPPPKPQLEEKLWFALFWMKPLEDFWIRNLTERGWEQLKEIIPYSWILDPMPLPPHAVYPRLEVQSWKGVSNLSQQERNLVIKISGFDARAWGSRGVALGSDLSKKEWQEVLQVALDEYETHPHLLQRFHRSTLTTQPYFSRSREITEMPARVRLTPYYFVSEEKVTLGGGLATLCSADKKLLHGMTDAILTPVGIIKS
ncbi:MAG: hypothetical protein K9M81_00610 [Chthoniobacterales bacterium]|nr:hypothetical protein [Chthoniobacterales bacterium]